MDGENSSEKLRAQLVVLNRALIESRKRSAEFENELSRLSQQLRAAEQEREQLRTQNQRLAKRISAMQSQLAESSKAPSGFGRMFGSTSSSTGAAGIRRELEQALEVANQDLRLKIEQNESLHKQLFEVERRCVDETRDLALRSKESEEQLRDLREELQKSALRAEDNIAKVRRSNRKLEEENTELRAEISKIQCDFSSLKENLVAAISTDHSEALKELTLNYTSQLQEHVETISSLSKKIEALEVEVKQERTRSAFTEEEKKSLVTRVEILQNELANASDLQEGSKLETQSIATSVDGLVPVVARESRGSNMSLTSQQQTGIVLRLSNYWRATDIQLNREALLRRYYEEKLHQISMSASQSESDDVIV